MSYTAPLSEKETKEPLKNFFRFIILYILVLCFIVLTILFFRDFWEGKVLWGVGSFITLSSVIELRYINIIKRSNEKNLNVEKERFDFWTNFWIKVEKGVQYSWLIGALILIMSKWIEF
jgi:hypothetical protein